MIEEALKERARVELARRVFWEYASLVAPSFYKEDRPFLVDLCTQLQEFWESDEEVMVVNMPPRHGKSRTASLFIQWVLGQDPTTKIMTGSYNESLSLTFSRAVRNAIQEVKVDGAKTVYSDIFPHTNIKKGESAMNLWSLDGHHSTYLATSPTGTATGFGCRMMVIDDLIKNSAEAYSDTVLEKHWEWFTNTMLSRLESGGKVVIVMTRWADKDLSGRALKHFENEGRVIRLVTYKAVQDDGRMLCEDILSKTSFESKRQLMGKHIAMANYQQEPIDVGDRLYPNVKTYLEEDLKDMEFEEIKAYVDTADSGNDWLCAIAYGVADGEAYVLDVIFTQDGMEVTEPETADFLYRNGVNYCLVESNGGGRGFARAVERELKDGYRDSRTVVDWFHQSQNKIARIISNSNFVMEHVYFPSRWKHRYPDFYHHIMTFQRKGKNKHDDGADALTGVAENIDRKPVKLRVSRNKRR